MHKLQFVDGSRDSVWLVEPKMTIGKHAANDLVLESPGLTDFHAEICVDQDCLYLINLNARNICRLNGKLVPARAQLNTNDTVEFDQVKLRVIDPKSDAKAKSPAQSETVQEGWYLEGNASWMTQKTFPLKGTMVIGREADCQLSFPVSHLSRRHAQLSVKDGYVELKDLESTNGTFLNGEAVTDAQARPGDKIRFDVVTFVLHGPQVSEATTSPGAYADDSNRTVLRRGAPVAKAPAPEPVTAAESVAPKPAPRPVPNLMTAAAKPAPKLSSKKDSRKTSHWPLVAGGVVIVLLGLSLLFLVK
jgi:pSer/pThr/pTyr-binding forkhead associated (FHA) protein